MERRLTHTWLTRKPADYAEPMTAIIGATVAVMTWMFWNDVFHAASWMSASGSQVFNQHQWWRLWTSLFAHADIGHILSNSLLFIPLSFFLTGYFGPYFFPLFGFFVGGVVNFVALKTMDPHVSLIGISGLVYWMGSAWLTLYLCVGSRESFRRRVGKTLFIGAALFMPQQLEPHVSYVSHFYGFVFGFPSALAYYFFNRARFRAAEEFETIDDGEELPQQLSPALIYAIQQFDLHDDEPLPPADVFH